MSEFTDTQSWSVSQFRNTSVDFSFKSQNCITDLLHLRTRICLVIQDIISLSNPTCLICIHFSLTTSYPALYLELHFHSLLLPPLLYGIFYGSLIYSTLRKSFKSMCGLLPHLPQSKFLCCFLVTSLYCDDLELFVFIIRFF